MSSKSVNDIKFNPGYVPHAGVVVDLKVIEEGLSMFDIGIAIRNSFVIGQG